MGKNKKQNTDRLNLKPVSLADQLAPGESFKQPRLKKRKREEEEGHVTQKEMNKFLKLAREQQADNEGVEEMDQTPQPSKEKPAFSRVPAAAPDQESDAESTGYEDYDDEVLDEETRKELEEFSKNLKEDELVDDFVDAVSTRQSEICSQISDARSVGNTVDEKTANVYRMMAVLMKTHRNGPLPKPFKLVPNHSKREELLELMEPENWSAAAVHEATCILVSNLKGNDAARFMERVLLPRIRDDIRQYNKLNFHLYKALFKCLFKCYSFIKGIILPLCKAGDCNTNEAMKISSIIANGSIKEVSVGLAICEICAMPYSPANMIILGALVEKRCALPIHAINSTIVFLLGFKKEKKKPQRWFSLLKSLVKHYKEYIPAEAKTAFVNMLEGGRFPDVANFVRQELKPSQ